MQPHILIVDDEKNTREGLGAALEDDYEVFLARDADEALQLLDAQRFDAVLTDLRMAGKSGFSVIDKTLALPTRPVCVMMTAYGNVETAVEAMRRGADDFLQKPVNIERLEHILKKALAEREAAKDAVEEERGGEQSSESGVQSPTSKSRSRKKRTTTAAATAGTAGTASHAFPSAPTSTTAPHTPSSAEIARAFDAEGVIGDSPALVRVIAQVRQVARSKATVLLLGETGTGKELFAQMLHRNSPRAGGPFVPVHCAALPAALLESELFGHERGAFTSAVEQRIGRFETANGGTLFLDEIGEIDANTQVKLLRFLESRVLERVGSNTPIHVDTRLVCATNRDLAAEVAKGTFREDLYYRLGVVQIRLPALRERPEDIPALLRHYLRFFARENEMKPPALTAGAERALAAYAWPGNIRELRNLCENLVVMHGDQTVGELDLDPRFLVPAGAAGNTTEVLSKDENEKRRIRQALRETRGNRIKAAQLLDISRRTLSRRLKDWPELDEF